MTQRILITRGRDGSSPTVKGGPLTIPFHTLLLDKPRQGEGDLVFTAGMMLHDLAERIWNDKESEGFGRWLFATSGIAWLVLILLALASVALLALFIG
jgi:hypothetical protein